MKINKSLLLNKFLKKISKYSSFKFLNKIKYFNSKSKKAKKSESLFLKISKSERYKNILDKINQFKNEESKLNKPKKSKKAKKSESLFLKILKSKSYQNIRNKVNQFKSYKISSKKNKILKISVSYNFLDTYKKKLFSLLEKINNSKLLGENYNLPKNKTNKKYDQKIGIAFYGDHNLIIASLVIDLNNNIKVSGLNEIPIPGNVVGDSLVEDINELANIALDSLTLLDLTNSPLLLVLSNSFFNIHTFKTSDLKQISQSDTQVQSKSPYLPSNTLVDFLRISDKKISNSSVRTIYANRDFIKGWTDTLEIIDLPIIGVVPAAPHIFDSITLKISEETTVLLDIESTQSNLLIGSNLDRLTSHKLPFGSSLYITNDLSESSKNFFERVINSIKLIMNENNEELPSNIFVMGPGLDGLLNIEEPLPKGFKRISELNLANYSYVPKTMQIHEIISKSIDSNIYSMASILTSCV